MAGAGEQCREEEIWAAGRGYREVVEKDGGEAQPGQRASERVVFLSEHGLRTSHFVQQTQPPPDRVQSHPRKRARDQTRGLPAGAQAPRPDLPGAQRPTAPRYPVFALVPLVLAGRARILMYNVIQPLLFLSLIVHSK